MTALTKQVNYILELEDKKLVLEYISQWDEVSKEKILILWEEKHSKQKDFDNKDSEIEIFNNTVIELPEEIKDTNNTMMDLENKFSKKRKLWLRLKKLF